MLLFRNLFSRPSVLAGLVLAGLGGAAQSAAAQQPLGALSKFDRANAGAAAASMSWYTPSYVSPAPRATAVVASRPVAGTLVVTVRAPVSAEPAYVVLRGPDGEVQRYTLEGGPASIQTREVIVRQGDAATFHFLVAAPSKGPESR